MLNYETLLSSYDDKLTLMQWLKKVEAALKDASAVSFKVNKKGDATLTFSIVFEDGSEIESGEIVLQQGESVESAAIVNGHLILTLTNGDELDAGQLLNGDLNVSGNLAVSGDIASNGKITGAEIVEDMTGYSFYKRTSESMTIDYLYAGVVKNGNKLTLALAVNITPSNVTNSLVIIGNFSIPAEVWNKLIPSNIGGYGNAYEIKDVGFRQYADVNVPISVMLQQGSSRIVNIYIVNKGWTAGTTYYGRIEATFLLSENLAA